MSCCSVFKTFAPSSLSCTVMCQRYLLLQCVAVCCSVLQCVAVCCNASKTCVVVVCQRRLLLQYVAVCCGVSETCVVVCCCGSETFASPRLVAYQACGVHHGNYDG